MRDSDLTFLQVLTCSRLASWAIHCHQRGWCLVRLLKVVHQKSVFIKGLATVCLYIHSLSHSFLSFPLLSIPHSSLSVLVYFCVLFCFVLFWFWLVRRRGKEERRKSRGEKRKRTMGGYSESGTSALPKCPCGEVNNGHFKRRTLKA